MVMKWVRGEHLGEGAFGFVTKASVTANPSGLTVPPVFAAKSAPISGASSLRTEKAMLEKIGDCPNVVRCFGSDVTKENGQKFYNLFFELASQGTLADHITKSGGQFPEIDIKNHARAVLNGLASIHAKGVVHCDIKPQNILIFDGGVAKIADLGLALYNGTKLPDGEMRGTALYMAPESASADEYGPACDIWAAGLVVAEMATGKMPWGSQGDSMDQWRIVGILSFGDEMPEIPSELSELGKDFLSKCFVRNPKERWTAEMLLNHAFLSEHGDQKSADIDDIHLSSPWRCAKIRIGSTRHFENYLEVASSWKRVQIRPAVERLLKQTRGQIC